MTSAPPPIPEQQLSEMMIQITSSEANLMATERQSI